MSFYQFLDQTYVDNLLEGEIIVGSGHYYRLFECVTNNDQIGDKLEASGVTVSNSGNLDFKTMSEAELNQSKADLKNLGIHVEGKCKIELGFNSFRRIHPCYIYSFVSITDISDGGHATRNAISDDYDACVEILDLENFAKSIWAQSEVFSLKGKKLGKTREFFDSLDFGEVNYADVTGNYKNGAVEGDPFRKVLKYSSQREFRLVFNKRTEDFDHVVIKCPQATEFLKDRTNDLPLQSRPKVSETTTPDNQYREFYKAYLNLKLLNAEKLALLDVLSSLRFTNETNTKFNHFRMQEIHPTKNRDFQQKATEFIKFFFMAYWELRKILGSSIDLDFEIMSSNCNHLFQILRSSEEYIAREYDKFVENLPDLFLPLEHYKKAPSI